MTKLAPYAGQDGYDRSWDMRTYRKGEPLSRSTKVIMASLDTLARYRRWREAAKFAPPTAATGGFPYNTQRRVR